MKITNKTKPQYAYCKACRESYWFPVEVTKHINHMVTVDKCSACQAKEKRKGEK